MPFRKKPDAGKQNERREAMESLASGVTQFNPYDFVKPLEVTFTDDALAGLMSPTQDMIFRFRDFPLKSQADDAAVDQVLGQIPDDYIHIKNNPDFREGLKTAMNEGLDAVPDVIRKQIKQAMDYGLIPPDIDSSIRKKDVIESFKNVISDTKSAYGDMVVQVAADNQPSTDSTEYADPNKSIPSYSWDSVVNNFDEATQAYKGFVYPAWAGLSAFVSGSNEVAKKMFSGGEFDFGHQAKRMTGRNFSEWAEETMNERNFPEALSAGENEIPLKNPFTGEVQATLTIPEGAAGTIIRTSWNFYAGLMRVAPGVIAGFADNPADFYIRGIPEFLVAKGGDVAVALSGMPDGFGLPFINTEELVRPPYSKEEVEAAQDRIIEDPVGVIMAATLAYHTTMRAVRTGGKTTVSPEAKGRLRQRAESEAELKTLKADREAFEGGKELFEANVTIQETLRSVQAEIKRKKNQMRKHKDNPERAEELMAEAIDLMELERELTRAYEELPPEFRGDTRKTLEGDRATIKADRDQRIGEKNVEQMKAEEAARVERGDPLAELDIEPTTELGAAIKGIIGDIPLEDAAMAQVVVEALQNKLRSTRQKGKKKEISSALKQAIADRPELVRSMKTVLKEIKKREAAQKKAGVPSEGGARTLEQMIEAAEKVKVEREAVEAEKTAAAQAKIDEKAATVEAKKETKAKQAAEKKQKAIDAKAVTKKQVGIKTETKPQAKKGPTALRKATPEEVAAAKGKKKEAKPKTEAEQISERIGIELDKANITDPAVRAAATKEANRLLRETGETGIPKEPLPAKKTGGRKATPEEIAKAKAFRERKKKKAKEPKQVAPTVDLNALEGIERNLAVSQKLADQKTARALLQEEIDSGTLDKTTQTRMEGAIRAADAQIARLEGGIESQKKQSKKRKAAKTGLAKQIVDLEAQVERLQGGHDIGDVRKVGLEELEREKAFASEKADRDAIQDHIDDMKDQIIDVRERIAEKTKEAEGKAVELEAEIAELVEKVEVTADIVKSDKLRDEIAKLEEQLRETIPIDGLEAAMAKNSQFLSELQKAQADNMRASGLGGLIDKLFSRRPQPYTPRLEKKIRDAKQTHQLDDVAGDLKNPVNEYLNEQENAPANKYFDRVVDKAKRLFVTFPELRGQNKSYYSYVREQLRQGMDAKTVASQEANSSILAIEAGLDHSQRVLLRNRTLIEDQIEMVSRGEKAIRDFNGADLIESQQHIMSFFDKDPALRDAYNRHRTLWDAMRADLIKRGHLPADARAHYYPHEVLDFVDKAGKNSRRAVPGSLLKRAGTIRLKPRSGVETGDISKNYTQVYYRALRDLRQQRMVEQRQLNVLNYADISTKIPEGAQTPKGYVDIWFESGKLIDRAATQLDAVIAEAAAGWESSLEGSSMKGLIPRQGTRFVIPKELADVLKNYQRDYFPSIGAFNRATSNWKALVLMKNIVRYNRRNFIGDGERVAAAIPQALFDKGGLNRMKRVIQDLWNFHKAGIREGDLLLAMDRGVIDAGRTAVELESMRFQEFQGAIERSSVGAKITGALGDGWNVIASKSQFVTSFREKILRGQVFYKNAELIREGKPLLTGISDVKGMQSMVDAYLKAGMKDKALSVQYDMAAKISRETLGDYGNFTGFETKVLRGGLAPFYSWAKINSTFWPLLFARQGFNRRTVGGFSRATGRGALITASTGVRGAAWVVAGKTLLATQVGALYATAATWNNTVMNEYEETLSPNQRSRFHIILPHQEFWQDFFESDEIQMITDPTAFSDFLEATGFDAVSTDVIDVLKDRISLKEAVENVSSNVISGVLNKATNLITPAIKAPVEATFGKRTFPDVRNPVMDHRDWFSILFSSAGVGEVNQIAETFGLKEGYSTELSDLANALFPIETSGPRAGKISKAFFGAGSFDPKRAALFTITGKAYRYKEDQGFSGSSTSPLTADKKAIFKGIVNNDDAMAIKGIKNMIAETDGNMGMTIKKFISYLDSKNPNKILSKDLYLDFRASLQPHELEQLAMARSTLLDYRFKFLDLLNQATQE